MARARFAAETDAGIDNALTRHLENPFLVLELPTTATSAEIERQGQKLLAMLAAGLAEARDYRTPLGQHGRSAELVRWSMSELREPGRRLVHEFWTTGWRQAP